MKKTVEIFDSRNKFKKELEFKGKDKRPFIGEFRWYYNGINIGREISKDGKNMRVCLIIQNQCSNGLIFIIPLTTKKPKIITELYIYINNFEKYNLKESRLLLNQAKFIDTKRLINVLGKYKLSLNFLNIIGKIFYKNIFSNKKITL